MEYVKVTTSPEVWAVIRARHSELIVFNSYSAPDGDQFNKDQAVMMTEYGFNKSGCPLIGAETRWEINRENPHKRVNEIHSYW